MSRRRALYGNRMSVPVGAFAYYKLDEASGNTLIDDSGNSRDLTANFSFSRSVGYIGNGVTGVPGNCFEFDIATSDALMNSNDGFTFACWIKTTGSGGIVSRNPLGTSGDRGFRVNIESNGEYRPFIGNNSGNWAIIEYTAGVTAPQNVWYHFAITIGYNQYEIYHNGSLVYTSSSYSTGGSFKSTSEGLELFSTNITGGHNYDEVNIYDRKLTQEEVALLASI